jgi:hypothetical protein
VLPKVQVKIVLDEPLLLTLLHAEQLQRQGEPVRLVLLFHVVLRVGVVSHHHLLVEVAVELLVFFLE